MSRRETPVVAYQGEPGAFSEEAANGFFGPSARPVPCAKFTDVKRAVLSGTVDYGLLPVENSIIGSIVPVYDLLAAGDLAIVGEMTHPIQHCLTGIPGSTVGGLRRVASHPAALAQCTKFLAAHPSIEAIAAADTAGAARAVAESRVPSSAAIASRRAAARYGLEVLQENIQDRHDNQTRFLAVGAPGAPPWRDRAGEGRTLVIAETENRPGGLVRLLEPFAVRGISLAKLECRPASAPWSYRFILELHGGDSSSAVADAIAAASRSATFFRVLGSYGVAQPTPQPLPIATAAVVGLGLIGGSIARELAVRGVRVFGEDLNQQTIERASREGVIVGPATLSQVDLVVLALPGAEAPEWLARAAASLRSCRLVIDVGSTKQRIVAAAAALHLDNFVGSHPLAGDHRAGWEASRVGLFTGATVFVCPHAASTNDALGLARRLWIELGGVPVDQEPALHDELLGWTSHLPQVVSTVLALALAQSGHSADQLGPGGRDVTRLALSRSSLWTGIALENRAALRSALSVLKAQVSAFETAITEGDPEGVLQLFERARNWRSP